MFVCYYKLLELYNNKNELKENLIENLIEEEKLFIEDKI
jgi:hypothetical protein